MLTWFVIIAFSIWGLASLFGGITIWRSREALIADPFVFGPVTGFVGYIIAKMIFGHASVDGWKARLVACLRVIWGVIALFVVGGYLLIEKPAGSLVEKIRDPKEAIRAVDDAIQSIPELSVTETVPPAVESGPVFRPMPKDWKPDGFLRR